MVCCHDVFDGGQLWWYDSLNNPLKENEHWKGQHNLIAYKWNQLLKNLDIFQKDMKTLRAPSYLASQITYLKEFMDDKNNTLKDMKTSLSNSKVAKVTCNS